MGWDYCNKGSETTADHLRKRLTWEDAGYTNKVIDLAIVKVRTAYVAVERIAKGTGERSVWACVVLLDYVRSKDEYFNFGTKFVDETMGPVESECPERILNLL